ncbi:MAG: hypothetical protein LBK60_12105 [Verrucomicrobiales bacterium]|jgi:hypothetical protein|nr:hypothetical protein [Verrucomicrobiales bacterium]
MAKSIIYSVIATLMLSVQSYAVTALEAVEIAKKQVNPYAARSLTQIVGKPSTVGQQPVEWQVLFFDPAAEQHGTLVAVSGNAVVSIRDGYTQLDRFRLFAYKMEEIIDPSRFKVDSPKLIPILQADASLQSVKITSLGLWLRKDDKSPLAAPVWYVDLYATSAKGDQEVKFGTAKVDAASGKLLKLDVDLKAVGRE